MSKIRYPRVASFKSVEAIQAHLFALGIEIPMDSDVQAAPQSPTAQPLLWNEMKVGNRWCILPMEGWEANDDGSPSDFTRRRWTRFGCSGAKLIWGGEAVAVCREGRSSPHQLWLHDGSVAAMEQLRRSVLSAHLERFGTTNDLVVGLQLTHSGRFARPHRKDTPEPAILYHHPLLDSRVGISPDYPLLADSQISQIIDAFVAAAKTARDCGFAFVDIKHCHGYLGHEFLSALDRPGPFGGTLENRTRFLREIAAGIRAEAPGLQLAVRLSAFDTIPYHSVPGQPGFADETPIPYRYAFGCDPYNPMLPDPSEPGQLIRMLAGLGIDLLCISAGSPYYNPHIQRPALFPPCDGYEPPEDPLAGVARLIGLATAIKKSFPSLRVVGSGYTYLQEFLPHTAQAVIRTGSADFVGLGRMVLSYPDLPAAILEGRPLEHSRLCRTFSECTTAPRLGLPSGCYPLDPFYRNAPQNAILRAAKTRSGRVD